MTSRFDLDAQAVEAAARMLGLRYPVRVFVRRYTWLSGRYIGFKDGEHRVGVGAHPSACEASETLWHELTHALQAERIGSDQAFRSVWSREMREQGLTRQQAARASGRRYRRTPLEAEAARNERRHYELALTRRRRIGFKQRMLRWAT